MTGGGLPYAEDSMMLCYAVSTQYRSVTDGRTVISVSRVSSTRDKTDDAEVTKGCSSESLQLTEILHHCGNICRGLRLFSVSNLSFTSYCNRKARADC